MQSPEEERGAENGTAEPVVRWPGFSFWRPGYFRVGFFHHEFRARQAPLRSRKHNGAGQFSRRAVDARMGFNPGSPRPPSVGSATAFGLGCLPHLGLIKYVFRAAGRH